MQKARTTFRNPLCEQEEEEEEEGTFRASSDGARATRGGHGCNVGVLTMARVGVMSDVRWLRTRVIRVTKADGVMLGGRRVVGLLWQVECDGCVHI